MAIVKCPECGGDVSDKAATCPHCGHPLSTVGANSVAEPDVVERDSQASGKAKEKKPMSRGKMVAIIVVAILLMPVVTVGGCMGLLAIRNLNLGGVTAKATEISVTTNSGETRTMTAAEILDAYDDNDISAQDEYFGAPVEFDMVVSRVHGRSTYNGHDMALGYIESPDHVLVEISTRSDADFAATLEEGDRVHVTGNIFADYGGSLAIWAVNGHATHISEAS